ncbi:hypothetical protein [Streptomyces sp. NPDC002851]
MGRRTTGRLLRDQLMTKSDRDPQNFVRAAHAAAPGTDIRVISPGERLTD